MKILSRSAETAFFLRRVIFVDRKEKAIPYFDKISIGMASRIYVLVRLDSKVSKSFVGLSHTMRIFFLLKGGSFALAGCNNFIG